ncbi:tetratricopeptide repeat protein [Sorangium sp. So ce363]|uniref:tetratricopeptide repeat protein n=1 Tax=Sorangium sp. So ce363 TaxID=3133304 RepID=UPI003F5E6681
MSKYRYPQPANEDAFEEFCLALVKDVWARPNLQRYGHRGERQYGIDLLDQSGQPPLLAVQCKHHDPTKTLPPKELEDEINKALTFSDPIGDYLVLTTAKKSTHTQDKVRKLNAAHSAVGPFKIHLLTWDELERLIDRSRAARQFLGIEADDAMVRALKDEVQRLREMLIHHGSGSQHSELDEVKSHLDQGRPQLASALLERVQRRSWADLTPGQRSRWCTLEADARLRIGEDKAAAKLLLQARTHAPDDEKAIINEIVARHILNEFDAARTVAEDARRRFPHSEAAYAACIELATSTEQAESLASSVPSLMRDAPDVLTAIAARSDLGELAERAARRGTQVGPQHARTWFALGAFLLDVELRKVNQFVPGPKQPLTTKNLIEARDAFSNVIEISTKTGHSGVRVTALLRRALVSGLLLDKDAARRDAESALHLAPNDHDAMVAVARSAEERGDRETAANILRRAITKSNDDESAFFLGVTLWNRNAPGDRQEAVQLLATVARGTGPHRERALEFYIECLLELGDLKKAKQAISEAESTTDPALAWTLRSRVAKVSNDTAGASDGAQSALDAVTERTPRSTATKLAAVLMSLGRLADAFPLLQQIAVPSMSDDDGRRFVECAGRLGRHGAVLDYCRSARENSIFDEHLLTWELYLLERYDPPTALTILLDLVSRDSTNHGARTRLVALALRLGRKELAREHVSFLPGVTEVDAPEGELIVSILLELGQVRDAFLFAYDLLRRYFTDHRAHRAFRDATLDSERDLGPHEVPNSAVPGAAVCLEERSESQWVVLEDSSVEASGVENEVRSDSPLAKLLVGKRVGDAVNLSDGPGLRRAAVVKEILPKHVFRARDVVERWQYRFPHKNEMWTFQIDEEDGKPNLGQFIELVNHRRRRMEEHENLYRTRPITVGVFAKIIGSSEFQALGHIASSENLPLRCFNNSSEDLQEGLSALSAASEVVVELSGLATLLMLDELQQLDALEKKLLISHSTMRALRSFVADANASTRSAASLGPASDGPRLFVKTEEQKEAISGSVERALHFVEERFTTVSALEMAYMDPDARAALEGVGSAALESAIISVPAGRVLWTDDGVLAHVLRERLGVRRTWTQAGLSWLVEGGRVDREVYSRASAKLIGWGYTFSHASPAVLRAAGNLATWKRDTWPLKQAVGYIGLPEVRISDAVPLGVSLVADAYVESMHPDVRRGILIDVLEALTRRRDIAERVLDDFGRALPVAFRLNLVGCADALKTLETWRTTGRHGIIRP